MKPENVFLIAREGLPDFVKLLDFGIAKVNAVDDADQKLTQAGAIFGTPEYMSPEQGRGDESDHRADIYAVGCLLYEMLTGDVPFSSDSFLNTINQHIQAPAERPTVRAPDKGIPPDLEAVVMRALAKDRKDRFQSMDEMAAAIGAAMGMETARPRRRSDPAGPDTGRPEARRLTGPRDLGPSQAPLESETRSRPLGRYSLVIGAGLIGVIGVVAGVSFSRLALVDSRPLPASAAAPLVAPTLRPGAAPPVAPSGLDAPAVVNGTAASVLKTPPVAAVVPRAPARRVVRGPRALRKAPVKPKKPPARHPGSDLRDLKDPDAM